MGDVIGIDGRQIDPLDASIRDSFYRHGQARATVGSIKITAQEWRAAARRVAKDLGRPVQTIHSGNHLHAVLRDFPRDERERAIHQAALRAVVESITDPSI